MSDLAKIEAQVFGLRNSVRALKQLLEERLPKQGEPARPALTLVKGGRDA
jgi:hypothetical protein